MGNILNCFEYIRECVFEIYNDKREGQQVLCICNGDCIGDGFREFDKCIHSTVETTKTSDNN